MEFATMNKRNEFAKIAQSGATNQRRVAMALVEAIGECRAEGVSEDEDPAVFLILHQLAHLLTGGYDIASNNERMRRRWFRDYSAVIGI